MPYKTIMVYFDNEQRAPGLLQTATALATQHSAHLIGLYVVPPLELYIAGELPVPAELADNHVNYHNGLCDGLHAMFDAATANQNFVSEWRTITVVPLSVADTIAQQARTVDLVVLSQKDADSTDNSQRELPENVILTANRPVVVVPANADPTRIGKEVFVGWDGKGQATRAVFDSLPILQSADSVTVHRINSSRADRHQLLGNTSELVNTLSRHDVKCELSESDAGTGDIGEELLNYAKDKGADMIVMGAYGHSRFREILFGGATKTVLRSMHTPVLMSH